MNRLIKKDGKSQRKTTTETAQNKTAYE